MDPFSIASMGIGLIGGIGKLFSRGAANRRMEELLKKDPSYSINPLAKERYAFSKALLNARMPGASTVERNINQNQANTIGRFQRNATDSSQLLALGAASQGQTNNDFMNLGLQEAQDYQRRYGNMENAREGMIREGDKVYNDQVRRYGNEVQLRGGQSQNVQNNWQDVANLGFGLNDFGMAGGFNRMFGGNGNGGNSSPGANAWMMPRMPYNPQLLPYSNE